MENYILALPLFLLEKVWREILIMLLYFGPKAGLGGGNTPSYVYGNLCYKSMIDKEANEELVEKILPGA